MPRLRIFALAAVALAGLAGPARAQHLERVYVPAHYETRIQRVQDPGQWVEEERVVEAAGHYETRLETVEVPGRWQSVERHVWVEGRWCNRGGVSVGVGFSVRRFGIGLNIPLGSWIPGHYETVADQVWAPPHQEQRQVQVFVPGAKSVQMVRVFKPGPVREVPYRVWVPAAYVLREIPAPKVHNGF